MKCYTVTLDGAKQGIAIDTSSSSYVAIGKTGVKNELHRIGLHADLAKQVSEDALLFHAHVVKRKEKDAFLLVPEKNHLDENVLVHIIMQASYEGSIDLMNGPSLANFQSTYTAKPTRLSATPNIKFMAVSHYNRFTKTQAEWRPEGIEILCVMEEGGRVRFDLQSKMTPLTSYFIEYTKQYGILIGTEESLLRQKKFLDKSINETNSF